MMPYEYQAQHLRVNVPSGIGPVVHGDIDAQITVSQAEYERVRQDKIELERHEVKASDTLSPTERQDIVAQKRNYVLRLDTIRKKIKDLEAVKARGGSPDASNGNGSSTSGNGGLGVSTFPTPVYNMGGIDGAISAAISGQPWPMHPASAGSFLHPWNAFQPAQAAAVAAASQVDQDTVARQPQQPEPTIESPASEPSPSSRAPATRRSHAVQIRAPSETEQQAIAAAGYEHRGYTYPAYRQGASSAPSGEHPSNLNPASPSYEPGKPYPLTEGSPPHFVVPAPTPIETPNPPPAELAKHWVFSQQQVHAQSQHNTNLTHTHTRSHAQEHARLAMNDLNINGRPDANNMVAGVAHHEGDGHRNGQDGMAGSGNVEVSVPLLFLATEAFVPGSQSQSRSQSQSIRARNFVPESISSISTENAGDRYQAVRRPAHGARYVFLLHENLSPEC